MLGVAAGLGLAHIFGALMDVNGATLPFVQTLVYSGAASLDLADVFIAATVIAASGAMMDLSMDIAAGVGEVARHSPALGLQQHPRINLMTTYDLSLEADLVEEIARVYGLDNIPDTMPSAPSVSSLSDAPFRAKAKVRETCLALGFTEAMHYSFLSRKELDDFDTRKAADRLVLQQHPRINLMTTDLGDNVAVAVALVRDPVRREPLEAAPRIAVPLDREGQAGHSPAIRALVDKLDAGDPPERALVGIARRKLRNVGMPLIHRDSRLAPGDARVQFVRDPLAVRTVEPLAARAVVVPFAERDEDGLAALAERMRRVEE